MHDALKDVLAERFPRLRPLLTWAPDRPVLGDPVASAALAQEIRASQVDLLFVGLGKPRQEAWIQEYGVRTGARVLLAFGAAMDFIAGGSARAPEVLRQHGLEWLDRLVREPRRLWRRYLVQGPRALTRLHWGRPLGHPSVCERQRTLEVGVIIVTYNSRRTLPALLDALRATQGLVRLRIVVVDNDSTDDTVHWLRGEPGVTVVEAGANLGYAAGINVGRQHLPTGLDAIIVINPDVVVDPSSIHALAAEVQAPGVGVAVPRLHNSDGTIFHSLRRRPRLTGSLGEGTVRQSRPVAAALARRHRA
jgi:hypothetical protein